MSKPTIKAGKTKTPDAGELATWPLERVQEEYQKHLDQWMLRSNAGQQNTWRKFEEMDVFYIEIQRRKYGPGAALAAKAELSNVMEIRKGED